MFEKSHTRLVWSSAAVFLFSGVVYAETVAIREAQFSIEGATFEVFSDQTPAAILESPIEEGEFRPTVHTKIRSVQEFHDRLHAFEDVTVSERSAPPKLLLLHARTQDHRKSIIRLHHFNLRDFEMAWYEKTRGNVVTAQLWRIPAVVDFVTDLASDLWQTAPDTYVKMRQNWFNDPKFVGALPKGSAYRAIDQLAPLALIDLYNAIILKRALGQGLIAQLLVNNFAQELKKSVDFSDPYGQTQSVMAITPYAWSALGAGSSVVKGLNTLAETAPTRLSRFALLMAERDPLLLAAKGESVSAVRVVEVIGKGEEPLSLPVRLKASVFDESWPGRAPRGKRYKKFIQSAPVRPDALPTFEVPGHRVPLKYFKIPKGVNFKLRLAHKVAPGEIREALKNFEGTIQEVTDAKHVKSGGRYYFMSKTNTGRPLMVVFGKTVTSEEGIIITAYQPRP